MKFPKGSKVEKLISKDPTQRVLENPWLDVERGVVLSSPGCSAVMIPVEIEAGDVSGPVPIEALKNIRRGGESLLCGEDYCQIPNGPAYPRGKQFTQYPPVERLMVAANEAVEISLNAKSLMELAQSMGTDVVKVRIALASTEWQKEPGRKADPAAPLVVTPHPSEPHVDGAMGALLPYRVARV